MLIAAQHLVIILGAAPEYFEPDRYGYSRPLLWLYYWSASSIPRTPVGETELGFR